MVCMVEAREVPLDWKDHTSRRSSDLGADRAFADNILLSAEKVLFILLRDDLGRVVLLQHYCSTLAQLQQLSSIVHTTLP